MLSKKSAQLFVALAKAATKKNGIKVSVKR